MNTQDINSNIRTILNILFLQREDQIYKIVEDEKELLQKKSNDYSKIYIAIDNIPKAFVKTKKEIENSIERYIDTLSIVQANENEKFYKSGFSDAFNLFTECLTNNSNNEKKD